MQTEELVHFTEIRLCTPVISPGVSTDLLGFKIVREVPGSFPVVGPVTRSVPAASNVARDRC